jgi:FlaA1/EpsC-like NDP-sugar epimerase
MIRNRYLLAVDLPLIALAACAAFAMRFDWRFYETRDEFVSYVLLAVLVKPVVYYAFGLYRRVWRYASLNDLLLVVTGVSAASVLMAVVVGSVLLVNPAYQFSRMVIVADWMMSVAAAVGARLSVRLLSERVDWSVGDRRRFGARPKKRLLIVGAGDAGAMVAREIQRNSALGLNAVGFLDDEAAKHSKRIYGIQVLGPLSSLDTLLISYQIDEVLIAIPSASGSLVRQIADVCRQKGVTSRTIPGFFELIDGKVSVSRVREINITDLLRREPIRGEVDASVYVGGRRVLITGGGGSIGQELARQVANARPSKLILLGHGENSLFDSQNRLRESFRDVPVEVALADVRDAERLAALFHAYRPDLVIHAAAHKHVPFMEEHAEEAVTNNVLGTRNVVNAALEVNASRLIMISTDKAVAPRNIMGASKRVSEMIVRDAALRHAVPFGVVRFGNVLGSRGSVVPFFQQQIERGGPITVTHQDMKRFFMTIPEAVHLVLQAGGLVTGGELFVLDMGEPVAILDLARDMIRLSGRAEHDVPIVFTGLRAGEKLEESLWESNADVTATIHPKVLRVHESSAWSSEELVRGIERLARAATARDRFTIEHEFAQLISSYVPASVGTLPG